MFFPNCGTDRTKFSTADVCIHSPGQVNMSTRATTLKLLFLVAEPLLQTAEGVNQSRKATDGANFLK